MFAPRCFIISAKFDQFCLDPVQLRYPAFVRVLCLNTLYGLGSCRMPSQIMDQRRHPSQFSNPTMAPSSFSEELRLPTEVIICNCKIAAPVPIFPCLVCLLRPMMTYLSSSCLTPFILSPDYCS